MATVEEITDRIREFESRIAFLSGLMTHVETHYVSSPNAQAELKFLRADGAPVPQDHISSAQSSLGLLIEDTQSEIDKLKAMSIAEPKVVVPPQDPAPKPKASAKGKKNEQPPSKGDD